MPPNIPGPAPRSIRVGSFLLSALLTLLLIWLLGFVSDDIGRIEGPDYQAVVDEHVDASLRTRAADLERQIADAERRVARQEELQGDLQRSMDNARETMQQMMDLQRLSLEQQVPPSEAEQRALATAQQRFLEAQERFEGANAEIGTSNETRFRLQQERQELQGTFEAQERPAREAYEALWESHRFKLASLRLAYIVPLFALAAWLFRRFRRSPYRSILLALLAASSWELGRVMFEHFPREFFKYIAIGAALAIVVAFLVWLLRRAARPSRQLLLARYREAYSAHVCPVCAFPMARGPLRFARWTRKGPQLAGALEPAPGQPASAETPYACPSCGTALFAPCAHCTRTRHALLPYCEHCGDELVQGPLAATS